MKKFAESLFYLCLAALLVVGIGLGIEQLNKDDEDVTETPVTEEAAEVLTIDGVEYDYEEGMTWAEWLESDYNTFGEKFFADGDYSVLYYDSEVDPPLCHSLYLNDEMVLPTDVIQAVNYTLFN